MSSVTNEVAAEKDDSDDLIFMSKFDQVLPTQSPTMYVSQSSLNPVSDQSVPTDSPSDTAFEPRMSTMNNINLYR